MNSDDSHPTRIVIKKKAHGGHHGGAWKVAYADFVTAMMALFIVLWIVAQNNQIKDAVASYFKNPGLFKEGKGAPGVFSGGSTPEKLSFPPKPETLQDEQDEIEKLKEEAKKLAEIIASNPDFEKFKDQIQITLTEEGLRIELIEDSQGLFFDVGSARVKPATVQLLKLIAGEVASLPNHVVVEGHTDSRPYVTPGYSNWELSSDRANATRKILDETGLRKDQISEVRGYADRRLRIPDKPLEFANRRVSILVALAKKGSAGQEPASFGGGMKK